MHSTLILRSRLIAFVIGCAFAWAGLTDGLAAQTPVSAAGTTDAIQAAESLIRSGQRQGAVELLSTHLAAERNDGRAWLLLGRIYLDDVRTWHRQGHTGPTSAPALLTFAALAFEKAEQFLTDSSDVYRVLATVERATSQIESEGWPANGRWDWAAEDLPLPPVLGELGHNLIASCPRNGVLVTGSEVETAAAWGEHLAGDTRSDVILLRPDMYAWDARYRGRMAAAIGADSTQDLPTALAHVAASRPICLGPTVDSIAAPPPEWQAIRLVRAAGAMLPFTDSMTVFQLGRSAPSIWTTAALEVYDRAAQRNRGLCSTLFAPTETPGQPLVAACRR
ncbi:MAG TPA: hypothetical protein VHW65_06210 [Gemmatimonadales bacterium]|jgi:hypothetical protein|nr:hypothetical protein [Gemmatimonadales bacterium]